MKDYNEEKTSSPEAKEIICRKTIKKRKKIDETLLTEFSENLFSLPVEIYARK